MILDPTLKLEAVLAGAVSANQPEVVVDYMDYNPEGMPTKPATFRVALNSSTDVTILAAPSVGFVREPMRISIYNKDTASVTVTVKTDDGTERILIKATLLTLETLNWEKGLGWYALDANGNRKEVTASTFSSLTVTNGPVTLQANGSNAFVMTTAGEITEPLQPAFLALLSADQNNQTGDGTVYTVICDTEVFDQGGDYNNSTGVFTAPVSGRYLLNYSVRLVGLTSGMDALTANIVTSNRTYRNAHSIISAEPWSAMTMTVNVIADMDAADTVSFTVSASAGAKVADVTGVSAGVNTTFVSGALLC